MGFRETVHQAKTYLEEHGRVSLRGLQRQFDLDNQELDELVEELVDVQQIARSDGKVLTGKVSLTPGRTFKLNIPKAGKLKTKDMITGQDVQYGKVRHFGFEPVREIRFYPVKEEMRRKWKFKERTKYEETGYAPAEKIFFDQRSKKQSTE